MIFTFICTRNSVQKVRPNTILDQGNSINQDLNELGTFLGVVEAKNSSKYIEDSFNFNKDSTGNESFNTRRKLISMS
jgi:hypothetical protein